MYCCKGVSVILYLWQLNFLINVLEINTVQCMAMLNKTLFLLENSDAGSDLANFIVSKGFPRESDLPKPLLIKNIDNDATYLLSKLSDQELVQLLNDQPMKDKYDIGDLMKALNSKNVQEDELKSHENIDNNSNKRFRVISEKNLAPSNNAYFKLDDKPVKNILPDPNYIALQNLNNLLHSRPLEEDKSLDEEKKELLFDVLVAQLKTLCCKSHKSKHDTTNLKYKQLISEFNSQNTYNKVSGTDPNFAPRYINRQTGEYLFLVINDEIKSNDSDELIFVDPDSLAKNSSVLLLGPINTPLTDIQLKLVISRISKELSKMEYLPLLKQLSEGSLNSNMKVTKSLLSGPETRRYIKPHRCNHQSKLARIYGGPKWLICTGYINLNTPSLYD